MNHIRKLINYGSEGVIFSRGDELVQKEFLTTVSKETLENKKTKLLLLKEKSLAGLVNINRIHILQNRLHSYEMKYLKNHNSLHMLATPLNEASYLFSKITEQLAYLHQNNIIVNDFNTENFFFDENRNLTCIDIDSFGVENYLPENIDLNADYDGMPLDLLDRLKLIIMFIRYISNSNYATTKQIMKLPISDNSKKEIIWLLSNKISPTFDELIRIFSKTKIKVKK